MQLAIRLPQFGPGLLPTAQAWLATLLDSLGPRLAPPAAADAPPVIGALLAWTQEWLFKAHIPAFETPMVMRPRAAHGTVWICFLPCFDGDATLLAFHFVRQVFNQAIDATANHHHRGRAPLPAGAAARASALLDALRPHKPAGFGTFSFVEAAHTLGIPWFRQPEARIRYGLGHKGYTMLSSLTDRAAAWGVNAARNKLRCSRMLRDAGLPVPHSVPASSLADAQHFAQQHGFPIVIKPFDLDGGIGVHAGIRDLQGLKARFEAARQHSRHLMVEQHIAGYDHRLLVVKDEVIAVFQRTPGSVTGDGQHSVAELLARQNDVRARATDEERRSLEPIVADIEAAEALRHQGLQWDTVPAQGVEVALRLAANVDRGGLARQLPLAQIHPDNLALAVRAARLLQLDVAGVDFLSPDPSVSWLQGSGTICEVNAQPGIFRPLHWATLTKLLGPAMGRIPVSMVLSDGPSPVAQQLHQRLCATGDGNPALVSAEGWWVGGQQVSNTPNACFAGARALLCDPAVSALVLAVSDDTLLSLGWPVFYCDLLVVAPRTSTAVSGNTPSHFKTLLAAARHLRPRVTRIAPEEHAHLLRTPLQLQGYGKVQLMNTPTGQNTADWLDMAEVNQLA
jgi:cyanophycin synthetase